MHLFLFCPPSGEQLYLKYLKTVIAPQCDRFKDSMFLNGNESFETL